MNEIERVKVVVAGDSGVGKSALVHLVSYQEPLFNPSWTIGCSTEIKIHDYKAGTPNEKPFLIEIWDIGGSSSHRNTRSIFYQNLHGVILVHDLTNKKSESNLHNWINEILNSSPSYGLESVSDNTNYNSGEFAALSTRLPTLVIGTKADLINDDIHNKDRRDGFASEFGYQEIQLACDSNKWLAPGSSNAVVLDRFFDKVVEMKHSSKDYSQVSMQSQFSNSALRRQVNIPIYKAGHVD